MILTETQPFTVLKQNVKCKTQYAELLKTMNQLAYKNRKKQAFLSFLSSREIRPKQLLFHP